MPLAFGDLVLPAEQGDPGPKFLGVVQELKSVARGAGRTAQDADNQVTIVPDELFHGLGAMIDHLQEQGPPARRDAGERWPIMSLI